jgi:hypothetical protein
MEFPLTITGGFLKRSHAKRIFRGKWFLLLGVALIVTGLAWGDPGESVDAVDQFGIISLIFLVAFFSIAWFKQVASINDWVRKQGSDPVIYRLSEDFIEAASNLGSSKLKWEMFHRLVISDLDLLLMFSRNAALTMPTDQVPSEAIDFLVTKFTNHSLKIEDRRKCPGKK